MRPTDVIAACVASHERLMASVATLSDHDVRRPSRLPEWTRAHVITHLARNADSFAWLFEGTHVGEHRQQYPEPGMRDRDIEAGSLRSQSELVDDLSHANRRLEAAWSTLGDDQWTEVQSTARGPEEMREILFRRLREVEIHHVDLDVGYLPSRWPALYVEGELRRQLERLPDRADHSSLVAWLVGRREVPELGPWL